MNKYVRFDNSRQISARFLILAITALNAVPGHLPANTGKTQEDADDNFTLNLQNADIHTLIQTVSVRTGRNFIVDPRVRATINVTSSKPVDNDKLYDIFLSVLEVHGYTAVQAGQITKIVPSQVGVQSAIPALPKQTEFADELVSQVIRLQNVSAPQLVEVLRPLLADSASITAESTRNTIVITDRAANIEEIDALIRQMDSR